MTDCSAERIERLIDGELRDDEVETLENHLLSCSDCTVALARASLRKAAIRRAGKRYTARPEIRGALVKKLGSSSRAPTDEPTVTPIRAPRTSSRWLPAAAAVLLCAGLAILFSLYSRAQSDRRVVLTEMSDIHASTLASLNPVDVISTDRHTVKPWFEGKLPFGFDLPDLQGQDVALIGGRVAWLHNTPAAHILVRDRRHRLSLFIVPADTPVGRALANGRYSHSGITYQAWQRGDLRYILLGDPDPMDLCRVARMFGGC